MLMDIKNTAQKVFTVIAFCEGAAQSHSGTNFISGWMEYMETV